MSKRLAWMWPTSGTVQSASSALGTKGIEILGKTGQPVVAAASGTVVYSGSGLRGYGQLIIVKHNEEFLSAYAHNDKLIVSEGVAVKQGQKIAEMGNSDAKRVMLHFEIRRDGKAVEPLQYLPSR
ncbi:MAG: peptidoglycan DD-metalloendopeptidase family protein [Proteobacteria bacterium]|nr:peptidoglycan DD-metalloendopeptidase family protein [Pseudomonadota bacterium]